MIRFYLYFVIFFSNQAIASVKGETLICDKDTRGYNFISNNEVKISSINLNRQKILSVNYLYELTESIILIKQPFAFEDNEEGLKTRPIGWIFRRNLDYVSLDYVNGDWKRKFSWNCKKTSLKKLETRLKNSLVKLSK
jgi:hypothetical protein